MALPLLSLVMFLIFLIFFNNGYIKKEVKHVLSHKRSHDQTTLYVGQFNLEWQSKY